MTNHIKALDGIRGFALLMVLVIHFGRFHPEGGFQHAVSAFLLLGWCGVDVFFCLSGFLITGILLKTLEDPDYFRVFYARRFLRIFPAYYVYITLIVLTVLVGRQFGYFLQAQTKDQIWAWVYLSNWHDAGLPFTKQIWSLQIEEQFYLLWPLAIFIFRRKVVPFCLSVAALSFLARAVAIYTFGGDGETIFKSTPFRLDGLALGSAAACIAASPELLRRVTRFVPWILGASLTIVVAIAVANGPGAYISPMNTVGYAAMAILFSTLVLHCATTPGAIAKMFRLPPLRHLGRFSYGIYIFQQFFVRSRESTWDRALLWFIVSFVGYYLVARISWRFIEEPVLRFKKNFEYRGAVSPSVRSGGEMVSTEGIEPST